MNSFLEYQLRGLTELLQNPSGILALVVVLFAAFIVTISRSARWVLLAIILYASTFSYNIYTGGNLAQPLQQIRSLGRTISAVGLVLLLIPTIFSDRGWRHRLLMGGLVPILIFQLLLSVRQGFGGEPARGWLGGLTYLLLFGSLGLGLSKWLQTPADAINAIRAIALAGVMFVIGCSYQFMIDRSQMVWAGRFMGTTGNANHAATLLACCLPATLFLLVRPGPKWWRIGLALICGLNIVMLVWTGSRTGAAIALVGIGLLFRFRVFTFLGAGLVTAIFVVFALKIFTGAGDAAARLLALDNTRTGAWLSMIDEFKNNPWVGIDAPESHFSENSYLLVAARTGIIGIIPFLVAFFMVLQSLIRVHNIRRYLGEHRMLADAVIAGMVSLAVGGMFEGYLFATYALPVYAIFIYLAVGAFLLDYVESGFAADGGFEVIMPHDQVEYEPAYASSHIESYY